ncbi:co-chaperone protein [Theileria orientalis strain Shintoku]|uniref:GrpE protein homolog n=1 Tax=Theileria orientalis strain Shintoku TaxID=869250 RepID=J4D699_THEOR|nr:co-chaperone protein [Theileria orientalis strain Shintoku]PVC50019.1 co-chaperone protein [Theileria orientalis]BAM39440.1 co-chaperone protein [Theileria orientalis strain Shintoku]|eukprot:XP_009689741.1 co-chaperone protein [Theileria orientalis strain Shintoku]
MKVNIYSPVCNNLLKNIGYSLLKKNGVGVKNIIRTNVETFYRPSTSAYINRRFFSGVDTSKESRGKLDKDSEEKTENETMNETDEQDLTPEDALRQENKSMKQKLSTLENKLKELELKYKLSLSNCDNMCKIHKKELDNAKVYAVTDFAKALLEVADTFELAFQHLKNSESEGSDDFVDGIKMTESLLQQTFERFGIERYESLNEEFNPQVHEAMFEVGDKNSHNKVIQVVKNGYKISGRILRPAKVGVSKRL